MTTKLILTLEEFNKYFEGTRDADEFVCGCGCEQTLSVTHGLIQRVEKDLRKRFVMTLKFQNATCPKCKTGSWSYREKGWCLLCLYSDVDVEVVQHARE